MSASQRLIITCGPSYEPIDQVRRITNSSTGRLGITLANRFAAAGWKVLCLKGVGATWPEPLASSVESVPFTTNADLLERLAAVPERATVSALFHAAALCDFQVKRISLAGERADSAKISSRAGELSLILQPAPKVISRLRDLFPHSRIVGWKYELEGSRPDVIEKGRRQIAENRTDACVLNGAAYGEGFGVVADPGVTPPLDGIEALGAWLAVWLAGMGMA